MQLTMNYKRILFSSGMIAVLFYVLHVVLGGLLWKEYNHLIQPISDLTATGSPDRELMMMLTLIYGILVFVFAVSFTIYESRNHSKTVFYGGLMLCALFLISLTYGLFPEDFPQQSSTVSGSMHIAITALIVPFTIMAPIFIGSGIWKEKNWKIVGIYSIISGILILISGSLCAVFFINKIPGFGLVERINIGVLQSWVFILSYKLTTK